MSIIKLTIDQLRGFAKELEETNIEEFLVCRKAIKVKDGDWSVMHYEGLKNARIEAFGGFFYENDIPYTFWNDVLTQVNGFIRRREEAEKARLEEMAQQQ